MFNEETVQAIREQSHKMEQTGEPTPQVLDFIYEHDLFKLFVPGELGGKMTPLPDALRIFEETAWIDGSLGWLVSIGSGGGFFTSAISPEVSHTLFSNREAVIAGSGFPSGRAKQVEGGFVVSGQWKYCSGSTHATIFTANAVIENETSTAPHIRSFIFLPEQVRIHQDWNAFGLKATASHSISVEKEFVPEAMTFDLMQNPFHFHDPIFHYPFVPFAQTSFAVIAIGIGRHFLEEANNLLEQNRASWAASSPDRVAFVSGKIKEMERLFNRRVDDFYQIVDDSWDQHLRQQPLTEDQQQQISLKCKETAQAILRCAGSIFPFLGIQAVMEETPVNRTWRDLQTACQHSLLIPFQDVDITTKE